MEKRRTELKAKLSDIDSRIDELQHKAEKMFFEQGASCEEMVELDSELYELKVLYAEIEDQYLSA